MVADCCFDRNCDWHLERLPDFPESASAGIWNLDQASLTDALDLSAKGNLRPLAWEDSLSYDY
jgi:hypothetical protein